MSHPHSINTPSCHICKDLLLITFFGDNIFLKRTYALLIDARSDCNIPLLDSSNIWCLNSMIIFFTWWIRCSCYSFNVRSRHMLFHTTNFVLLHMDGIWFINSMLMLMNYSIGISIIYFDHTFIYAASCMRIVNYFTIVKHSILSNMSLLWSLLIITLHKVCVVNSLVIHGLWVIIYLSIISLCSLNSMLYNWAHIPPPSKASSKHRNGN